MAKYMGVELELVPVTGPNRIPYLLTGKVDMLIAAFGITPERARQVMFSIPYSSIDILLVATKDKKITGPEDLKAFRIGVPRASTPDAAVTAMAPPGTRIMRFDDEAMTNQAMLSGQIDTLALSTTTVRAFLALNPSLDYETKLALRHQPNGIALRRRQADLMQWINTFIYYVKNNGELDAICRKWIGTPLPEMPVF
jgi:polar amino acid transport system substrate-binding protein